MITQTVLEFYQDGHNQGIAHRARALDMAIKRGGMELTQMDLIFHWEPWFIWGESSPFMAELFRLVKYVLIYPRSLDKFGCVKRCDIDVQQTIWTGEGW